ncbi:hypothetical protein BKA67DRAFT_525209 [Truncatella angustata]|uniref:F-box domain-containing protein n=1 Tax=Truncatella angustata TaxID=152316 RepID=A0A9P8RPB2_9PEZI|nr:uncharacterized protein BKA67DRAFT_525209 [Truncatella angustata]KAH6646826.1 hypothetical protein BKA67DRAFT_525209 [Truncatella angustata]
MNCLPQEILTAIAEQLPTAADVCQLRLVEKRCAVAAFPVLFERVQILNTSECLHQAESLLQSPYGSIGATKHLTLYQGTWPLTLSLSAWRGHSLRLRYHDNDTQTFEQYTRFSRTELSRHFGDNSAKFCGLVGQFSQLQSLCLADVHTRAQGSARNSHYNSLKDRIQIVPSFHGNVNGILTQFSTVLNSMRHLTTLSLEGCLDTSGLDLHESFSGILSLEVIGLLTTAYLGEHISRFLASFPHLTHMRLRPALVGCPNERKLPLSNIQFSDLCHVEFHGIWTSEEELLDFVYRHGLISLSLSEITFTQGSWESFFGHLRDQLPGIQFRGDGILTTTHSETYQLNAFSVRLLRLFLATDTFPWPLEISTFW